MSVFQDYINSIPSLVNIKSLTTALCNLGLYPSIFSHIYGHFKSYQHPISTITGINHDPYELARLLIFLKNNLNINSFKSFLYVGAGSGYAFFAMYYFLKHYINPNLVAKTINTDQVLDPQISPFIAHMAQIASVSQLADHNEGYDLVFIDKSVDTYDAIKHCFDNLRRKANLIIIHNISDKDNQQPAMFFKRFKKQYPTYEIKLANAHSYFGYGLIELKQPYHILPSTL